MTISNATYVLRGHGRIEPGWMRECFQLFRGRNVNIRKLVLMKDQDPDCYAMMEIQFVLTPEATESAFIETLEERLAALESCEKTLVPA